MKALIEDEVERHVGRRYAHATDRTAVRWGHDEGHVVFAGRKVAINRPRVRARDGHEIELFSRENRSKTMEAFETTELHEQVGRLKMELDWLKKTAQFAE